MSKDQDAKKLTQGRVNPPEDFEVTLPLQGGVPDVEFAVPFLLAVTPDEGEKLQPNPELMVAYFDSVHALLKAKTIEAIQMGATASRVRVFIDFE